MNYSRQSPSRRYLELLEMYRCMHVEGDTILGLAPERTFNGHSLLPQVGHIKKLIGATGATSLLDYGCGKAEQWGPVTYADAEGNVHESLIDYLEVDEVHCYDPACAEFAEFPVGTFDGVICTDVLEHCPETDISWIVGELFTFASKFVFANVASFPARKTLPNGENAHCTIKPLNWWHEVFSRIAERKPEVVWELRVTSIDGQRYVEQSTRSE